MSDIGDYWSDHKEYVARKKLRKGGKSKPPEPALICSCGKKYYSCMDLYRMKDHMQSKGKHELVYGELVYGELIEAIEVFSL